MSPFAHTPKHPKQTIKVKHDPPKRKLSGQDRAWV
jgi:hypothetical protein